MHPAPPSSTQPISTSTQLHPPPPSSFQPPSSSLKQLGNFLRFSTHGILEVVILNPDLHFWNSDPKIHFWANLDQKSHICPFCLKIGTQSILRMLILILTLVFSIPNPNLPWANLGQKSQNNYVYDYVYDFISPQSLTLLQLRHCVPYVVFMFCELVLLQKKKVKIVRFGWKLTHRVSRGC